MKHKWVREHTGSYVLEVERAHKVRYEIVKSKPGWWLKINGQTWDVEPTLKQMIARADYYINDIRFLLSEWWEVGDTKTTFTDRNVALAYAKTKNLKAKHVKRYKIIPGKLHGR